MIMIDRGPKSPENFQPYKLKLSLADSPNSDNPRLGQIEFSIKGVTPRDLEYLQIIRWVYDINTTNDRLLMNIEEYRSDIEKQNIMSRLRENLAHLNNPEAQQKIIAANKNHLKLPSWKQ